jgi:hypothetical protein
MSVAPEKAGLSGRGRGVHTELSVSRIRGIDLRREMLLKSQRISRQDGGVQ